MNIEEQNPHELDTTSTTPIVEETIVQEEISKEITSNDEDDDENDDIIDYSSLSKEELVSEVKKIRSSDAIKVSKKQLGEIKSAFDDLFHSERKEAHATFLSEGGEKDGFEYIDIDAKSFYDTLKEIHELKRKHKSQQEEQRVSNTRKKRILLDELRELVDGEETPNTFNQIKELQKTWRDTGHVAQADYQELNANYSALLDRYFSFRSIYFDLKNLDKDKNLELKTAIIGEVIALLDYENTLEAIKKLNELHAQYKSIGPVAEEFSDILWDNLKLVTDKVRDKRTAHIEAFKVKLDANLIEKKSLLPQLESFASIQAQSAKEWITLTEELTALQNRWKAIGMVPDEDKKSINDLFWAHSRAFYNNKNEFFNGLDNERKENHKKKLALIEKVKALKNSDDFKRAADDIKRIQEQWKKIGQSPRAVHESVYQDFRKECDFFFNRRSENFELKEQEYTTNLEAKNALIAKINALKDASEKETFESLIKDFFAIGFVPKEKANAIQRDFLAATEAYIAKLTEVSEQEIQKLKLSVELGAVKGTPAEKDFIYQKTKSLRNKISSIQEEISTLNNNIEFFANSKSFASLKADVDVKVGEFELEIDKIKEQLKVLKIQE